MGKKSFAFVLFKGNSPIIELQALYPSKMLCVVRDKNKVVCQCTGSDNKVKIIK
jgi:hypothetical protein